MLHWRLAAAFVLPLALIQTAAANDRQAVFDALVAEYQSALENYSQGRQASPSQSPEEQIADYEAFPLWNYLPRFVAIAEGSPGDQVSLQACRWVIDSCRNCGTSDARIFAAEKKSWEIVDEHHSDDDAIAQLCLEATHYETPAREEFLRKMIRRTNLSDNAKAYALLALAEYLAKRSEIHTAWDLPSNKFEEHLRAAHASQWTDYYFNADVKKSREESIDLLKHVIAEHAERPFTLTAGGFRDLNTFDDKARKSLHALEHLYVGAPAPDFDARDLHGKPLRLADYRGRVVLLSFWFTGCGPCIGMVPKEQELTEKYRDKQFALIGVCRDSDAAISKKTAGEHGMNWPSIHDGSPGRVTDDYNVLSWPSFYVIDADGKIAAKDASWEMAEETIARLVSTTRQDVETRQ
jgi:peroxiredoxin